MLEFQSFRKIPRLSREMTITEKIDGTNGQICIISSNDFFSWYEENVEAYYDEAKKFFDEYCLYVDSSETREFDLYMFAGSRKRWLDTSSKGDNFGFAKWVKDNAEELLKLGEGRHYGEYIGAGIQRKYGLSDRRFFLFNTGKWFNNHSEIEVQCPDDKRLQCPKCCDVVPILYEGMFDTTQIDVVLNILQKMGSLAVHGFMNPEGIVIFHHASGKLFKKTIIGDSKPKGTQ